MILVKVFLMMAGVMLFFISCTTIILRYMCVAFWRWVCPSPKNQFSSSNFFRRKK